MLEQSGLPRWTLQLRYLVSDGITEKIFYISHYLASVSYPARVCISRYIVMKQALEGSAILDKYSKVSSIA
jgi:hypothetical protein